MQLSLRRKLLCPCVFAALFMSPVASLGGAPLDTFWQGDVDNFWGNPSNWSGGLPGASTKAIFSDVAVSYSIDLQGNQYDAGRFTFFNNVPFTIHNGTLRDRADGIYVTNTLAHHVMSNNLTTTFSSGIGFRVDTGAVFEVAGRITNTPLITKTLGGKLILSSFWTFTGNVAVADGTLELGKGFSGGYISGNITNDGTILFNRSGSLDLNSEISGTGRLIKDGDGLFSLHGQNTFSGGTIISNGTLLAKSGTGWATGSGGIELKDGTLGGTGRVQGTVRMYDGTYLAPGEWLKFPLPPPSDLPTDYLGKLTVEQVNFTNGSTFHVELFGTTPESQHDQLSSSTVNLDGVLDVNYIDFYTASAGDTFTIIEASNVAGTFDSIEWPDNNPFWDITYSSTSVVISIAVPEPVLHWPLDEGTGTNTLEAISGETNVATLVGPAAWTNGITPTPGTAVSFDIDTPDSYIDAGTLTTGGMYIAGSDTNFMVLKQSWTITAWINLEDPQGNGSDRVIASSDTGPAQNWWLFFVQDAGPVQESLGFDFGSVRRHSNISIPLETNVFVSVMAQQSGIEGSTNKYRFSVWDGTCWYRSEGTYYTDMRLHGLEIGSFNTGTREFDGVIDDVRIFGQTLSQLDLDYLSNADSDGDGMKDFIDSDDDGDGISDVDENSYNTNPKKADTDGDGQDDPDELIAGTDATDSSQYWELENIWVNSPTHISILTVAGRRYTFEYTTNLLYGPWSDLSGYTNILGDGLPYVAVDLDGAEHRTYRARVINPPPGE